MDGGDHHGYLVAMASASTPLRVPVLVEDEDRRQALIRDLQAGMDQIDRGETMDGDEFFALLWEEHRQQHGRYPHEE
jgi:predicted transcriptional regulator